jgi:PRC-barrel domain protein
MPQVERHAMKSRRITALCLLLATASGCELHAPLADRPRAGGTRESLAGVDAEARAAEAPVEVEAVLELPRLLRSTDLFGASVVDADEARLGELTDLLVEPATGRLVGVVIEMAAEPGDSEPRLFGYDFASWGADESGAPRLTIAASRAELAAELETDAGYAGLFDGQDALRVTGEVRTIEPAEGAGSGAVIVKLHDEENLLHRVLLEPAYLVIGPDAPLVEGGTLSAAGVVTRDTTGKLLVAKSMQLGDGDIELRDETGAVRWDALRERFRSTRALAEQQLVAADDTELKSTTLFVDWDRGVIEFVGLDVDGIEHAMPWSTVDRTSEVARAAYEVAELVMLPVVTDDGQVADQL